MVASTCVENILHVVNEAEHLRLFSKMRNIPAISKLLNRQERITSETAVAGYLHSKIHPKKEAIEMPHVFKWYLRCRSPMPAHQRYVQCLLQPEGVQIYISGEYHSSPAVCKRQGEGYFSSL